MKKKYNLSRAKKAKTRKNLKVQKSFRLDPEVLLWLEEQGEAHNMGYQTFLNWYLKCQLMGEKSLIERLNRVEAEVFKKNWPELRCHALGGIGHFRRCRNLCGASACRHPFWPRPVSCRAFSCPCPGRFPA